MVFNIEQYCNRANMAINSHSSWSIVPAMERKIKVGTVLHLWSPFEVQLDSVEVLVKTPLTQWCIEIVHFNKEELPVYFSVIMTEAHQKALVYCIDRNSTDRNGTDRNADN